MTISYGVDEHVKHTQCEKDPAHAGDRRARVYPEVRNPEGTYILYCAHSHTFSKGRQMITPHDLGILKKTIFYFSILFITLKFKSVHKI